jgi:hypothetical protein
MRSIKIGARHKTNAMRSWRYCDSNDLGTLCVQDSRISPTRAGLGAEASSGE